MARSGLGKGLDALIPGGFQPQESAPATSTNTDSTGALIIPIGEITPNPRQPRSYFDEEALTELADSIREHGVIQPLIVTRNESGGYTLIAGERRWQASQRAGLEQVPVVVRQTTDQQRLELALIENIQRADLNPLEEAHAYLQLSEEFTLSHEEIATRVGKSRVAVTNTLRLLKLPQDVLKALLERRISEGHARALLGLPTQEAQSAALKTVLTRTITVRETEELVRNLSGQKPAPKLISGPAPDIKALQDRIQETLGTEVSLKVTKNGKSALTLYFYSEEELNSLLSKLT